MSRPSKSNASKSRQPMYLLQLLEIKRGVTIKGIILVTSLAGLGNASLIGLINEAAEQAVSDKPLSMSLGFVYICAFAFFYIANRASLKQANGYLQERLGALRQRIVGKIRKAPLRTIETVGHGELFAAVAQETNHLSQNLPLFVSAIQSAFLLVFCMLYIATLSLPSFVIVTTLLAWGLWIFWRRRVALNILLAKVYGYEAVMLDTMESFTAGFQEIRLNADKNDGLFRQFTHVVDELENEVVGVAGRWVVLLQFSNAFLYALVGVVIFVLPMFFDASTDVIYKIVAAVIFAIGPVTAITAATHLYAKAEIGLGHVYQLETRLDAAAQTGALEPETSRFIVFNQIDFEKISFSYLDPDGKILFSTGPWNLQLKRGEVVFFVGGNGSGKSTAMKLMSGLYLPDSGRIAVDGAEVTEESAQEYRELFSAIFPDFHLFHQLHGLGDIDPAQVTELIERMELTGKVSFENGRFSTLDLSTGQRKRLAMIASLLEDREIYLFDEWAADQDSHFREIFYDEILPTLKEQGKTIIAVTHDDRYWSRCDRRVMLDLGAMTTAEGKV
ncbi:MAG: cyclic peptide export ABC transporter [Halopseudomonas aestusnigri]